MQNIYLPKMHKNQHTSVFLNMNYRDRKADLTENLLPSFPLTLRFYNQCRPALNRLLPQRPLKLHSFIFFYLNMKCTRCACIQAALFHAGDTSTGRLPISIIDTLTDIQLHPARNDAHARFSLTFIAHTNNFP